MGWEKVAKGLWSDGKTVTDLPFCLSSLAGPTPVIKIFSFQLTAKINAKSRQTARLGPRAHRTKVSSVGTYWLNAEPQAMEEDRGRLLAEDPTGFLVCTIGFQALGKRFNRRDYT